MTPYPRTFPAPPRHCASPTLEEGVILQDHEAISPNQY